MESEERDDMAQSAAEPMPEADPAVAGFAWGYFAAILIGTVIIIAIICTIATLSKKQEAAFSYWDGADHASAKG